MKQLLLFIALVSQSVFSHSEIRLPRVISDGMVIQRNVKVKVWGWASANEKVSVLFSSKSYSTTADAQGNWFIILSPQSAGGPFIMEIKGGNTITLKNILIGDVWVCSGQSNMELTMERVKDKYPQVIAQSENPNIRQFLVPDKYDFKKEQTDLDGGSWISANPQSIFSFSAVAYFFAKDLYEKYHVPIGLINAALGGSPAEAWLSEDALRKFPDLYQELQRFKDDKVIESIESEDQKRTNAWYTELNAKDHGILKRWKNEIVDEAGWKEIKIPEYSGDQLIRGVNGSAWFRKRIIIPESMIGKTGKLWLGRVVDADSAFINGKFVGNTTYQYPPRKYNVSADLLHEGENTITVKVISNSGRGGFVLDKPYFLAVDRDTIDLKGNWKYNVGAIMPPLEGSTAVRFKPAGLFNKMISPLIQYSIKGVIWYQGESNTKNPKQYGELFPAVIKTWREKWHQGDFPFLFVQLANFMEPGRQPSESDWAELRQAQLQTLSLPNTRMVVTIDVGEWNDIHPLDKETVGKRLSLAAMNIAYHDRQVVYSGPVYTSHVVQGNKIIISFNNPGSTLISKGSELRYFSIAGSEKYFVWAKAKIENDKVIVWSDEIDKPTIVRYAWADNPQGANLYNKEGLPASPFTTEK